MLALVPPKYVVSPRRTEPTPNTVMYRIKKVWTDSNDWSVIADFDILTLNIALGNISFFNSFLTVLSKATSLTTLIPPVVESLLNNLPDDDYYKSVHSTPEIFNKMLDKKLIG